MVLGLFLLGGLIQVLATSRATYRLAEAQARIQENGRYAMQSVAKEMRPSRSPACRNMAQEEIEGTINVLACALLSDPANCTSVPNAPRIGTKIPLGYSPAQPATDWLAGLPTTARTAVDARWLRGDVLVSWGAFGEGVYAERDTLANSGVVIVALPIKLVTES